MAFSKRYNNKVIIRLIYREMPLILRKLRQKSTTLRTSYFVLPILMITQKENFNDNQIGVAVVQDLMKMMKL